MVIRSCHIKTLGLNHHQINRKTQHTEHHGTLFGGGGCSGLDDALGCSRLCRDLLYNSVVGLLNIDLFAGLANFNVFVCLGAVFDARSDSRAGFLIGRVDHFYVALLVLFRLVRDDLTVGARFWLRRLFGFA